MNHRLIRYLSLAALAFCLPALIEPPAHGMKPNKGKRRNPQAKTRQTPPPSPLVGLLLSLPQGHGLPSKKRRQLSDLAAKYEAVPALNHKDADRSIEHFSQQVTKRTTLASGILDDYAQALEKAAQLTRTGAGQTKGKKKRNKKASDGVVVEGKEATDLHSVSKQLRARAAEQRTRSHGVDLSLQNYLSLDWEVPELKENAQKLEHRIRALGSLQDASPDAAAELVPEAEQLITAGTNLLARVPESVTAQKDGAGDGAEVDSEVAAVVQRDSAQEKERYRSLFERIFLRETQRIERVLVNMHALSTELCRAAGLPEPAALVLNANPSDGSQQKSPSRKPGAAPQQHRSEPKGTHGKLGRRQAILRAVQYQVAAALKGLERADPTAVDTLRERAQQKGFHRALAEQLEWALLRTAFRPNPERGAPVGVDGVDDQVVIQEALAEHAVVLLNSLARGEGDQEPLGWSFSLSTRPFTAHGGKTLSRSIRFWDDHRLLGAQGSEQPKRFWRSFSLTRSEGVEERILAGSIHRAVVELLVEKQFRNQLSRFDKETIGSENRAWVSTRGIPLAQILGMAEATADQHSGAAPDLDDEGPRFVAATKAVFADLMARPTPAFQPFVRLLEGRGVSVVWKSKTRRIALEYDNR